MIKVKTLVFCENVMSTEMFTKCLRPIVQQCLSCQHGATASWDITSTLRGVNASLLKDTTRRGTVSNLDLSFWSQRFYP